MCRLRIETLFADNVQYTIDNIYDPVSEMEKDLNDYAMTFFHSAYREYQMHVSKIEQLLGEIGKALPPKSEDEKLTDYLTRCCIKLAV